MSADIIAPFNRSPVPVDPDQGVIDTLESLLERARKGEIAAIAYATLEPNGTVGTAWTGDGSSNLMLDAVSGLQVRYARSWLDSD